MFQPAADEVKRMREALQARGLGRQSNFYDPEVQDGYRAMLQEVFGSEEGRSAPLVPLIKIVATSVELNTAVSDKDFAVEYPEAYRVLDAFRDLVRLEHSREWTENPRGDPDVVALAGPRSIHLTAPAWESAKTTVWMLRLDESDVALVVVTLPDAWLSSGGFAPNLDRPFEGTLTLRSKGGPPGIHFGTAKIEEPGGKNPYNNVLVSLRVVPSLRADPPGVIVVEPDLQEKAGGSERTVRLRPVAANARPVKTVVRADPNSSPISAELRLRDGDSTEWDLIIKLDKPALAAHGTQNIDVLDSEDRLLATVPVIWFAAPLEDLVVDALKDR